MNFLLKERYKVSWKADGTRYMMLIEGKNMVYFADRDHAIFKVEGMTFPYRKDESQSLTGTILDGEMVLDDDPVTQSKIPRYLIYDIVSIFKGTISSKTLCSRNFQNVKLKKHGVEILQFARFYMKSNFGAFKQSKMSFLALLEVLDFNSSKFEPFLKHQIYQNSNLTVSEMVKMANFDI